MIAAPPRSSMFLSSLRRDELDCRYPITNFAELDALIPLALKTTDEMCSYLRSGFATDSERESIITLKNMMLRSLWRERQDLFQGVWDHTSIQKAELCKRCHGQGYRIVNFKHSICDSCGGSAKKKAETPRILTVFAIQTHEYQTTWHFPKNISRSIIGTVPSGDDLIELGQWKRNDIEKAARVFGRDEVEAKREYVAWFLARFQEESDRWLTTMTMEMAA